MQVNLLELLLSQSSLGGNTFGIDKFQHTHSLAENQPLLLDWLSTSMSAARSLMSMILVLPPGEEHAVSNTEWIVLYCGLSLAARLDLIAAHGSTSGVTQHLRRFLEMPHTLRQIVLRLESAACSEVDATGDRDGFFHLARRAHRLEEWYLERCNQTQSIDADGHDESRRDYNDAAPRDETEAMEPQANWAPGPSLDYAFDPELGNFLFSDPLGFPTDVEDWAALG